MPEMTERPDATELNATQRDLLFAVAAAAEGPGAPTLAETRAIAVETSRRFPQEKNGTFYDNVDALDADYGYLETAPHPKDGRTKRVGLTVGGEQALGELAERSDNAALDRAP
jgi:hypothetical protein